MSRWTQRVAVVAASGLVLLAAGCGGDDSSVATSPTSTQGSAATTAPSAGAATTTAPGSPTTTTQLGPGPLVPANGQSWSDLYPDGQPPVFPLPRSSAAFPAAESAAIGFAR